MEVVEALEGDALRGQVLGEPVAGEDTRRGLRDAPVGEPIAHVDEPVETSDVRALARLATHGADGLLAEHRPPAVGPHVEPVGDDGDIDAVSREQRFDQLVEAHRDHEWIVELAEVGEPRTQRDALEQEPDDLLERRFDRGHLGGDDLLQRAAGPYLRLHRGEDVGVPELRDGSVQRVTGGDGPVPIDHERRHATMRCTSAPIPSTSILTTSSPRSPATGSDAGAARMSPG